MLAHKEMAGEEVDPESIRSPIEMMHMVGQAAMVLDELE